MCIISHRMSAYLHVCVCVCVCVLHVCVRVCLCSVCVCVFVLRVCVCVRECGQERERERKRERERERALGYVQSENCNRPCLPIRHLADAIPREKSLIGSKLRIFYLSGINCIAKSIIYDQIIFYMVKVCIALTFI